MVQWLRFRASSTGCVGLIPDWGTKIQPAARCSQKQKNPRYKNKTKNIIRISWIISEIVHLFTCSFVYLLWKNAYSVLLPFFIGLFVFLIWSYLSCLYILDINPLSIMLFAVIFPHTLGYLFISVNGILCCANIVKFSWFYFCFYFFCFRRLSQENTAMLYVSVLPMFSSWSFMVSILIFSL